MKSIFVLVSLAICVGEFLTWLVASTLRTGILLLLLLSIDSLLMVDSWQTLRDAMDGVGHRSFAGSSFGATHARFARLTSCLAEAVTTSGWSWAEVSRSMLVSFQLDSS